MLAKMLDLSLPMEFTVILEHPVFHLMLYVAPIHLHAEGNRRRIRDPLIVNGHAPGRPIVMKRII